MKISPFQRSFDSLEDLVDTISEYLKAPVTLEDSHHKVLAYSSHDIDTDPARTATIISRRVPEHVIHQLWKQGIIQKLQKLEQPVRIPEIQEVGLKRRVAIAIRNQDQVLGYIYVLETKEPLEEEAFMYLQEAAKAARTILLQWQIRRKQQQKSQQEFLWKLITGHYTDEESIYNEASQMNMTLPPFSTVMVLEFQNTIPESIVPQIQYFASLNHRIRTICFSADQNQFVLLVSPKELETAAEDIDVMVRGMKEQIGERISLALKHIGIGKIYSTYTQLDSSYKEALTVLELKKQYPTSIHNIYQFNQLGYYYYLPFLSEKKKREKHKNPYLDLLRNYDKAHGSELVRTLKTYLSYDGHLKHTSENLHIHANTLHYRMSRIQEITGLSLKNMDEKVSLYLDLKLEEKEES